MNNAGIALRKIKDLHSEIVSLDSSNTSILKESRHIETFVLKAARDTNFYRKRLSDTYGILEKKKLDFAIFDGLDSAGMDKDMIEDLVFARNKPIDKALEHLREFQQQIVDIKLSKRDLVTSTTQLERQLKNSSEKIEKYEATLSGVMTFLGRKGMLDLELIQALNGSETSKEIVDAVLDMQSKQ